MRFFLSSVALLLLVLLLSVSWISAQWSKPLIIDESVTLTVSKGETLSHTVYELAKRHSIVLPRIFLLKQRLIGHAAIHTGEYQISSGSSLNDIVLQLNRGDVVQYRVSLIEGTTFSEALARLQAVNKLSVLLADSEGLPLKGEALVQALKEKAGIQLDHPEGQFFPDTYQYTSGMTDVDILQQAHRRLHSVLAQEWKNRSVGLPYKTPYEALIMASIVEKETGLASERPDIAGVFVRRMQKNMRLETDPTVIYGMGDKYQGNIKRRHLREPTPYNTYVIKGLPPTPIALVGREAIHAALHPSEGESLFFVAKGDGSHQFSTSLAEHNAAVDEYQRKKRVKNYRSSPSK